tara:strand:+ start:1309 stop:1902 length:594 start_codon:yes stop_codon:yes gene_type:complete
MYKLGITGGIASGKTTAANYLSKYKGVFLFNADKESKKHLKKSHALQKKIINVFGQKVVKNNKLDLQLLAEIAFSNSINHKILNGIMWPEIFVLISNVYNEVKDTGPKLFIVDAAVIFEANFNSFFDECLLISANKKIRIERGVNRKNIPLESLQNRISLQMSESKKKKLANHTILNNGTLDNFYKKIDAFYLNLKI